MTKTIPVIKNPLSIIALFIGLTETVLAFNITNVRQDLQPHLIWFLILFPTLYALGFFFVLIFRPQNFYGPTDYQREENYIEMNRRLFEKNVQISTLQLNSQPKIEDTTAEKTSKEIIENLNIKICWFLIKVQGRALTAQELTQTLTAELDPKALNETFEKLYFLGYLQCILTNFSNVLFSATRETSDGIDKLTIHFKPEVIKLLSERVSKVTQVQTK